MAWKDLSLREKAAYIHTGVRNGLTTLEDIGNAYNKFAEGGNLFGDGGDDDKAKDETPESYHKPFDLILSDWIMRLVSSDYSKNPTSPLYHGGLPQRTYLASRGTQRDAILNSGLYIEGTPGDYGLVSKAVGNRNLPVYQRSKDDADRDDLIVMGNSYSNWYGKPKDALIHPGHYPSALYMNPYDNGIYQKAWDLNDYGGSGGSTANIFGKLADAIGNPIVQTTGYKKVADDWKDNFIIDSKGNVESTSELGDRILKFFKEKGLTIGSIPRDIQMTNLKGEPVYNIDGTPYTIKDYTLELMLPEVTIKGRAKKNKNFARNARKRKHGNGGYLT